MIFTKNNFKKSIEITYVFVLRRQHVPHRGDNFGHLAKGRVRILTLDGSLSVPEEQCVRGNGSVVKWKDENKVGVN